MTTPRDEPPAPSFLEERGATAVEYAFLASLIALVIAGAVAALGIEVRGLLDAVPPIFTI